MIRANIRDQRGVAAITVMLVTAVLAVAAAAVVFTATSELEIGARDRAAEDAFTASEAGLDIAALQLFQDPTFAPGQTQLCLDNPLVPASAGIACEIDITSPSNGQLVFPSSGRPFVEYTVISRAKEGGEVTRTLGATYRLEVLEIPFGMFINGNIDLNGTPALIRESLLVNGTVTSRNKLSTDANGNGLFDDPDLGWEFHKDLITSDPAPNMCAHPDGMLVGCTGVFANFQILAKNTTKNSDEIHFGSSDPALSDYPNDRDVHQTAFDSNGEAIPIVNLTGAQQDVLEVMGPLKDAAVQQGNYFNFKDGSNQTINIQPQDLNVDTRDFERNAIFYIDADAGDTIKWKVDLIPGSTSSDIKYTNSSGQRVGVDSGVIVVRNASLHLEAGTQFSGALFVPEGKVRLLGTNTCTCTIYATGFTAQGGNSTVQLTTNWFDNLPGGFVSVRRTSFFECERFQSSSLCPPS